MRGFASKAKPAKTLKLINIKSLVGFKRDDTLLELNNCQMLIKNGKIDTISVEDIPDPCEMVLDTHGALVTPGFVDPHTHIFPPKDRANEFTMRVNKTYQQIAAAGGGIQSSVNACRDASFEELFNVNERNVKRFIAHGTTTLEIKSGYGLNLQCEIQLLRVINKLKKKYAKEIEIVPTFLGAHAYPKEYLQKKEDYVQILIHKIIQAV